MCVCEIYINNQNSVRIKILLQLLSNFITNTLRDNIYSLYNNFCKKNYSSKDF